MSISHLATKNGYQWATTSPSATVSYLCATGVRITSDLFQFPGIAASGAAGAAKARLIYEKLGRTVTISLQLYNDGNVPANVGQGVAEIAKTGAGPLVITPAETGNTFRDQLLHDIRCIDQNGAASRLAEKTLGAGLVTFIANSYSPIILATVAGNIDIRVPNTADFNAFVGVPVVNVPDTARMCPSYITFTALDDLIVV